MPFILIAQHINKLSYPLPIIHEINLINACIFFVSHIDKSRKIETHSILILNFEATNQIIIEFKGVLMNKFFWEI